MQTPVTGDAARSLPVGDNVYMRHAKAGELCERFDTLYLVAGDEIVDEVPTYRGEGAASSDSTPGPQPPTGKSVGCNHHPFDGPPTGKSRTHSHGRSARRCRAGPCARRGPGRRAAQHRLRDDRRPDGRLAACDEQGAARGCSARAPTFTPPISSYPLCCPSRATYLTGQYSHNHGVIHNAGPFGGYTRLRQHEHAAGVAAAGRLPHDPRRPLPQRLRHPEPGPHRDPAGLERLELHGRPLHLQLRASGR